MPSITSCLWFDTQGKEAAEFYTSIFPNSRITAVESYPGEPDRVMIAAFEIDGNKFVALNGGPQFTFSEAISFQIDCASQEEVDHYWSRLGEGGEPGPCGWLKDKYGLSWQVVPTRLKELLSGPDRETSKRVMDRMMKMGKLEIAELEDAAAATTA
jgi:predicted 3-demethylubiquinone-9 3-methyltransferase (glyoxalase superfamily)